MPDAKRGRSKEKRNDCPLLTLALVVDASGFVVKSRTFAGNVAEYKTLAQMIIHLCQSLYSAGNLTRDSRTLVAISNLSHYRYIVSISNNTNNKVGRNFISQKHNKTSTDSQG